MLMRSLRAAILLLPIVATPLASNLQKKSADEAFAAARAELARLDWMVGNWTGERGGIWYQELWLTAKGSTMFGVHHEVQQGVDRTLGFEFLRIEAREDGVFYLASPDGRPATPFALEHLEEKSVTFANPEHDFPQRIRYERKGDELFARVEGAGSSPLSWRWKLTR